MPCKGTAMSNTTPWSHARALSWLVILCLFSTVAMARAASPSEQVGGGGAGLSTPAAHATAAASREVLVRFNTGVPPGALMSARARVGASIVRQFTIVPDLQLLRLPPGMPVPEALALFRQHPAVRYAEPNHLVKALGVPNDSQLGELWGLWNTGQEGGTPGADIDAPLAWDLTTGSRQVVVAVIDTGIDYMHPDLAANMFRNEADCAHDGVDHDGNGFPNDCFGIDTANGDSDPRDDHDHGTHVAGTIGAVGDNGLGVVGINWTVSLMACKFLNELGSGSTAGAIACLEYVAMMKDRGVNIIATNNSWGGREFSQALHDAIDAHRRRGILFVAAAGNNYGSDNDTTANYPSNYDLPNIIAVAATTRPELSRLPSPSSSVGELSCPICEQQWEPEF
jgi:serine protease